MVRGRPFVLINGALNRLLEYLDNRPSAYLDKMSWFLFDNLDVVASKTTIWRALSNANWSRKQTKKRAAA